MFAAVALSFFHLDEAIAKPRRRTRRRRFVTSLGDNRIYDPDGRTCSQTSPRSKRRT
jgi:hypothetical protein